MYVFYIESINFLYLHFLQLYDKGGKIIRVESNEDIPLKVKKRNNLSI